MNIILTEKVTNLGNLGDIVHVKPGYARNYLLPQGKAIRATKENIEIFEVEENPMDEFTVDDEDVEPFQLVNIRNVEVADRNFVVKMHNYIEKWETWEPETPLQNILKNGVDLINKS